MLDRSVSHYKFIERLGAGGMGEIYKAQDIRLNRIVAVKMVTATTGDDIEKRRRFLQEARAASGLNHPNIITVHDMVSDKDSEFLVMEYISGKTLGELIRPGGMPPTKVVEYAIQITDALGAAHKAGIVHRDIKPGNIMVTEQDRVKVLDFGLAKFALAETPADPGNDATKTMFTAMTVEGSILGTVSYMSPEQAEGKPVDARSDIFSFGIVLYEMLTGQKAFKGQSALSTLSAILRDEAKPIREIAPGVPPNLAELTARCLAKQPQDRWQSMIDIHTELRHIKELSDTARFTAPLITPAPSIPRRNPKWINAAAIVLPGVILVGLFWMLSNRASAPERVATSEPAAAAAPDAPPAVKPAEDSLTNQSIIDMVKAKVPPAVIASHVRTAPFTNFDVSTAELIHLGQEGVPEQVIQAMSSRWRLTPPKTANAPKAVAPSSGLPVVPAPANAVTTIPGAAPAVIPSAVKAVGGAKIAILNGTPLEIILKDSIPEEAAAGTPVLFTAKQDIRVDGAVVIAAGSVVRGEIAESEKRRFPGMGGKLSFRLKDVVVAGGTVKVRALPSAPKDGDARRPVERSGAAKPTKGMAADAGSVYIAYVDGEQSVSPIR
jgi:serine/threonine protein kinase